MSRFLFALSICLLPSSLFAQEEIPYLPSAPTAEFFHKDSIVNLVNLIRNTPPQDFRSLVVIKGDKLVTEEYFHTFWRSSLNDIRSAGKSITGMLMGVAIQQGLVKSVEDQVYDYLDIAPPTKAHAAIKIKHLLTMSAGYDADSDDGSTPGQAGQWNYMEDWNPYIQKVPMKRKPGAQWVYSDLNSQLIGKIIENKSGMSLSEFARKYLFGPLGVKEYYWQQSPAGSTVASGNLFITGLDFAKLGWLVLHDGNWLGKQLMSKEYIKAMTGRQIKIDDDYFGFPVDYGYFWYTRTRTIGDKEYTYHYASGNGGNYVIVIPEENMVISLMSSAYGPYHGHGRSNRIFEKVMEALN